MTESETAAAVTREPSRFPAADATADVRRLAPGVTAETPATEADVRTPTLEAAGMATGTEAGATADCHQGCGCVRSCDYGLGYGYGYGYGGEMVTLPRRWLPEAAHTLASPRAVVGASSR